MGANPSSPEKQGSAGAKKEPKGKGRCPFLAADCIVRLSEEGEAKGIVLIERGKEPFGYALPGGHVEYGESAEYTCEREMEEEIGVKVKNIRQMHTYSAPDRDPRKHTASVVFVGDAEGRLQAGDDAAKAFTFPIDQIPWDKLVFDHKLILTDYINNTYGNFQD